MAEIDGHRGPLRHPSAHCLSCLPQSFVPVHSGSVQMVQMVHVLQHGYNLAACPANNVLLSVALGSLSLNLRRSLHHPLRSCCERGIHRTNAVPADQSCGRLLNAPRSTTSAHVPSACKARQSKATATTIQRQFTSVFGDAPQCVGHAPCSGIGGDGDHPMPAGGDRWQCSLELEKYRYAQLQKRNCGMS